MASKENCDLEALNAQFRFMGNIRISPRENVAKAIFYLMFPRGGFIPSGYQVLNKSKSIDNPSFDIVEKYPINTQIIQQNIGADELINIVMMKSRKYKKI